MLFIILPQYPVPIDLHRFGDFCTVLNLFYELLEHQSLLLPSSAPSPTQLGAELVIFSFDPATQPPTRHTRKVVSSHNTAYLSEAKCQVLVSKVQKHIYAFPHTNFNPVQSNFNQTPVPVMAELGPDQPQLVSRFLIRNTVVEGRVSPISFCLQCTLQEILIKD